MALDAITIDNFRTLTPKILSRFRGQVIFPFSCYDVRYEVESDHLSNVRYWESDGKIFRECKLCASEFCTKVYGYEPVYDYSFPHCKKGDFRALCNVIVALFEEIEKENGVCSAVCKSNNKLSFFQKLIFLNK